MAGQRELSAEWVHIRHPDNAAFGEMYGFASSQNMVNLEGVRFLRQGTRPKTLVIMMHPSSALEFLPMPRALAEAGVHVLCAGSRYFRNDTPLIMEKVALDLGSYVRHAREVWKYEKVVLLGWSGGGPLSLFYQSQAEHPTVKETPAGDPVDLTSAGLLPADAIIFQAANASRATLLCGAIDPSVLDEDNPDIRDPELDIFDPRNPNHPPYSAEFIARYRDAQLARMRRRTAWVKETLERLRRDSGDSAERGFVTHRTTADLRYLDPAIDPNDRRPGWCYLGKPEVANRAAAGLARFSTLRAWLSQWSIDDSNVSGPRAASAISVPTVVISNSADDAVPPLDPDRIFEAVSSRDKTRKTIKGANHYYAGQPELLAEAVGEVTGWLQARGFVD